MGTKNVVMSIKEIDYIRNSTVARDMVDNAKRETLRRVGEWLDKYMPKILEAWTTEDMTDDDLTMVREHPRIMEVFRRGEMPE